MPLAYASILFCRWNSPQKLGTDIKQSLGFVSFYFELKMISKKKITRLDSSKERIYQEGLLAIGRGGQLQQGELGRVGQQGQDLLTEW